MKVKIKKSLLKECIQQVLRQQDTDFNSVIDMRKTPYIAVLPGSALSRLYHGHQNDPMVGFGVTPQKAVGNRLEDFFAQAQGDYDKDKAKIYKLVKVMNLTPELVNRIQQGEDQQLGQISYRMQQRGLSFS